MKSLLIIAGINIMWLAIKSSFPMSPLYRSSVLRQRSYKEPLFSQLSSHTNSTITNSKQYLVEFRSTNDLFRINELIDCAASCGVDASTLSIIPLIMDMFKTEPIAAYVNLPNDETAVQIASRSCTIRSIIEIWGMQSDLDELVKEAFTNYLRTYQEHFHHLKSQSLANTWRVNFRHYGIHGFSQKQKVALLRQFQDMFFHINGTVDLTTPTTKLVYMEDFFDYQNVTNELYQTTTNRSSAEVVLEAERRVAEYKPRVRLFGRQVAKGPKISATFDLRSRPYIGTTTMDALSAHITANAARVLPGHRVLDPFCGTGSILLPCALIGARVIGTDIDEDCLGLCDRSSLAYKERSKNSNFIRQEGYQELQSEGSVSTNFKYYKLDSMLEELRAMDASSWLDEAFSEYVFDAIVSDPPFGIRERTKGESAGQPLEVLLKVAAARLRSKGRLVFWMPSDSFRSREDIRTELDDIRARAGVDSELQLLRIASDEMNTVLWRWLCVLERV